MSRRRYEVSCGEMMEQLMLCKGWGKLTRDHRGWGSFNARKVYGGFHPSIVMN